MKALFEKKTIPATVVELDTLADGADVAEGVAEVTGRRTVPQVFIGGKHVGGCDGKRTERKMQRAVCGQALGRKAAAKRPLRPCAWPAMERDGRLSGLERHSRHHLSLTHGHRHEGRRQVGRVAEDAGGGWACVIAEGRGRRRERERVLLKVGGGQK